MNMIAMYKVIGRGNRGSTLVTAVFIMLLLLYVLAACGYIAVLNTTLTGYNAESVKAFYTAESGRYIARAVWPKYLPVLQGKFPRNADWYNYWYWWYPWWSYCANAGINIVGNNVEGTNRLGEFNVLSGGNVYDDSGWYSGTYWLNQHPVHLNLAQFDTESDGYSPTASIANVAKRHVGEYFSISNGYGPSWPWGWWGWWGWWAGPGWSLWGKATASSEYDNRELKKSYPLSDLPDFYYAYYAVDWPISYWRNTPWGVSASTSWVSSSSDEKPSLTVELPSPILANGLGVEYPYTYLTTPPCGWQDVTIEIKVGGKWKTIANKDTSKYNHWWYFDTDTRVHYYVSAVRFQFTPYRVMQGVMLPKSKVYTTVGVARVGLAGYCWGYYNPYGGIGSWYEAY